MIRSTALLIIGMLCLTSFATLNVTRNEVYALPSQWCELYCAGWGSGSLSYSYSGGSGTVSTNQSPVYLSVTPGMQINLTAYPDGDSGLTDWGQSGCVVANPYVLSTWVTIYSGNASVDAYFILTDNVSITSLYGGNVFYSYDAIPSGVDNGTVYSGQTINLTTIEGGTTISLTGTPNVGYVFCSWFMTGPASISNFSSSTTTMSVTGNGVFVAGSFAPQGSNIDPTSWPMFHNDLEHSGFSTSTAPTTNQTLWNSTLPSGIPLYASPAVAGGVLYVGSENYYYGCLYALNAMNGTIVWESKPYSDYPITDCPAVANGVVYAGAANGYLYAYNAATGVVIWSYNLCPQGGGADIRSSPTVANGIVYIGSKDNYFFALNAATGALVWNYFVGNAVYSSPAVVNGIVYFQGFEYMYALNALTGAALWTDAVSEPGNIVSSPVVANGVVYAGCGGYGGPAGVYAFNASTGKTIWVFQTNHGSSTGMFSSPAVAYGIVYEGYHDGNVFAVNATTGTLIWSFQTGGDVESSPAVADGVVYVGSDDGNVYALNALTGISIWNYTTSYGIDSSPAIAGGVVYVDLIDGDLYAFGRAPVPLSAAISPSSVTLDVGESQTFTSNVTGGTTPYSYQWYLNGSLVSGAADPTWTFTPSSPGSYTVYLQVIDSVEGNSTSLISDVTVYVGGGGGGGRIWFSSVCYCF